MRSRLFAALALVFLTLTAQPTTQGPGPVAGTVPGEILVKFRPGATGSERAEAHRAAGGVRLGVIERTRVERVRVAAAAETASIARYRRNPNVLYAELHHLRYIPEPISHGAQSPVVPADNHFGEQWGLYNTGQLFYCIIPGFCLYVGTPGADIDAPEAWAVSKGSPSVTVAVIDSGVDYNHPDLASNYVGGFDFYNNDPDPMDDHGHGTHVAGTIAAVMDNLTGEPSPGDGNPDNEPREEGVVGVAPLARILAYKVCGPDGSCTDFGIQQAIADAIRLGARVINMSLGQSAFSQTLDDSVQDAWAAGLVIVAGAGNDGTTGLFYPAASEHVISVAAFDEDHLRASFSNYGTWVDISGPGNVIMSTYPLEACGGLTQTPGDTGCYTWLSGTSMATPHVAGAAALVWSRPDIGTNTQVVDALLESADPVGASAVRLDSWTIHGGLNLHDAMSYGVANDAPVADAGPDQALTDTDGSGAEGVTLDGSGSSDPDGTIATYEWREGTSVLATGVLPTVTLALGAHTLTLVVTDDDGSIGSDNVVITVQPQPAVSDTVTVLKATYNSRRHQLSVEATSSAAPGAVLTVYDSTSSPVRIGDLSYQPKKARYTGAFTIVTRPSSISIVSSEGGSASSTVTGK
jgi:thermitase